MLVAIQARPDGNLAERLAARSSTARATPVSFLVGLALHKEAR